MIWFIDIDGCLCDNHSEYIRRSCLWLDNNMIEHSKPNIDVYDFGKAFSVDGKLGDVCFESEEFAGYYIIPPNGDAVEFLKHRSESGDVVAILTSRIPDLRIPITTEVRDFLGKLLPGRKTVSLQVLTKIWLDTFKVPYDNIIHRADKAEFMKDFPTGVAVEDSPYTLAGYACEGVRCIAMSASYNLGLNVPYVKSWKDMYSLSEEDFTR